LPPHSVLLPPFSPLAQESENNDRVHELLRPTTLKVAKKHIFFKNYLF
jgi:hypothetical protein